MLLCLYDLQEFAVQHAALVNFPWQVEFGRGLVSICFFRVLNTKCRGNTAKSHMAILLSDCSVQ